MIRRTLVGLAFALALAAPAMATADAKPTPGALAYWQDHVALKAPLPNWWKGYLGGPFVGLSGCKWMNASGTTFRDCEIKAGGTVLGFAAAGRIGKCAYFSTLVSADNKHTFTRRFRHCG